MKSTRRKCGSYLLGLGVCLLPLLSLSAQQTDNDMTWVQFRGPNGSGVAAASMTAPTQWSAKENIKWQVDLPGLGSSSPIVLGDKIYLTSYTDYGMDPENPGDVNELKRHLICLNREDGSEAWRATVDSDHDEDPFKGFITEHGYASSTPVTDGENIYAFFGKTGVVAFNQMGKQLWKTNVGTQTDPAKWGGGSSCVLVGDILVVNAGNEGRAIVGLNKTDGSEVWRVEDETFGNSWTTPVTVELDGHTEVVFSMPGKILALDPQDGKKLWHATSPIAQTTCASLALKDDVVIAMGGRAGRAIAVKCGGKGDVTESHVVWEASLSAGIGTPIQVDNRLFWNSRSIAYCANAETGEILFKERMKNPVASTEESSGQRRRPAGSYASPIAVGGNVYLTTRGGTVFVISNTDKYDVVSVNQFPDDESRFNATPAVAGGELLFRSEKRLYCVGN